MATDSQAIFERVPSVEAIRRRLDANLSERAALRKLLNLARAAQEARQKQEAAK